MKNKVFSITTILLVLLISLNFANAEITLKQIKENSSFEEIRMIQSTLYSMGYYKDNIDGAYGPATEKAVLDWFESTSSTQSTNTYNIDNLYGKNLIVALEQTRGNYTNINFGDDNASIYALQNLLKRWGFYNNIADGLLGRATFKAMNEFMECTKFEYGTYIQLQETASQLQEASIKELPEAIESMVSMPIVHDMPIDACDKYITYNKIDPSWYAFAMTAYDPGNEEIKETSSDKQIKRLQTRLTLLGYYAKKIDGKWNNDLTDSVTLFQAANALPETGYCNKETSAILFSADAQYAENPKKGYKIKVNTKTNRVTIFGWNGTGMYEDVYHFKASCGRQNTPTPVGTFQIGGPVPDEWYYMEKSEVWVKYTTRINGPYYFHSVLFTNKGDKTPTEASMRNLGVNASHGCVRLSEENAKWIYEHIQPGTTCIIY